MPWAVSPSTIKENTEGLIFHHGFSPGFDEGSGGHSLVSKSNSFRIQRKIVDENHHAHTFES